MNAINSLENKPKNMQKIIFITNSLLSGFIQNDNEFTSVTVLFKTNLNNK